MIQFLYYGWNEDTNQFQNAGRNIFTYDLTCNFSDLIIPSLYEIVPYYIEQMSNKMVSYSYEKWDEAANAWIETEQNLYYYSEQTSSMDENVVTKNVALYPNPVADYLVLSYASNGVATLELLDIQGRVLISRRISNNEQLDLTELESGIYLYNLYLDGNKQSGRLIKE